MPKAFSALERKNIRKALIDAAVVGISRNGFRKFSIDSLVDEVHISKGAFYQFFPTKEMLIFEVLRYVQEAAREEIWAGINRKTSGESVNFERRLLQGLFSVFTKYPVFAELSKPDSLVELIRGLPHEVLETELESDEAFFSTFFAELIRKQLLRKVDLKVLCGLPRMVLALEVNKELIGLDRYEELKEMFISGIAHELKAR